MVQVHEGAPNKGKDMDDYLYVYRQAINKIEDHFEYNGSKEDKLIVDKILEGLADDIEMIALQRTPWREFFEV